MLGISVRGVWKLTSAGEIPKPIKIGCPTRWWASDRRARSFPARDDLRGRRHFIVAPADDETRHEVGRQVLDAFGLRASTESLGESR